MPTVSRIFFVCCVEVECESGSASLRGVRRSHPVTSLDKTHVRVGGVLVLARVVRMGMTASECLLEQTVNGCVYVFVCVCLDAF